MREPTLPCLALLAAALPLQRAAAQDLLIQCKTLVVAPDTVVTPGEFLVRDGKVAHVGREIPAETRARARVLAFTDATIVPGFVLAHASLGHDQDLAERAVALTPALLAAEAFDPFEDELLALPRYAVTCAVLAPTSRNVAGGIAAVVKPGGEIGRLRQETGYAKFSLAPAARDPERPPTSLMGAIDLLRQALLQARTGVPPPPAHAAADVAAIGAVVRGERRAVVHVDARAEILAALALASEFGFAPVLVGASAATECLDAIAAARTPIVLTPLQPGMRREQLELPSRLEAAGVPFCFDGSPVSVRAAAALCVRHGASRRAALAALTRTPAELCGIDAAVGALRRGCDADFAVFGGDPLDLGSALLAVFVDGERRFGSAPAATAPAPDLAAAQEDR
jgi:imidazolonepropionase-like amidohydrolase